MRTYAHATPDSAPTKNPAVKLLQPSLLCRRSRLISRPERVLTPSWGASCNTTSLSKPMSMQRICSNGCSFVQQIASFKAPKACCTCWKLAAPYIARAAVKMATRPAADKHPAVSAYPGTFLRGPSLMKGPAYKHTSCRYRATGSVRHRTRLLPHEPVTKRPCTRPISTPLNSGDTPVRYAGKLLKKLATTGAEVTGVSSMPMNGSPLIG